MKVAEGIAHALKREGVEMLFAYPIAAKRKGIQLLAETLLALKSERHSLQMERALALGYAVKKGSGFGYDWEGDTMGSALDFGRLPKSVLKAKSLAGVGVCSKPFLWANTSSICSK